MKRLIIICIVLIISLGLIACEKKETAEQTSTPPRQAGEIRNGVLEAGTFKVGKDMPAGEYIIIDNGTGYVQVDKGNPLEPGNIVSNDNISTRSIVTIKDGEYLTLKNAKAYKFTEAPNIEIKDNKLNEGMYKVGVDIKAGEYKVVAAGKGYFEITKDSRHILDSVVTNDIFENEKYVTVKDGQYLKISDAYLILK